MKNQKMKLFIELLWTKVSSQKVIEIQSHNLKKTLPYLAN